MSTREIQRLEDEKRRLLGAQSPPPDARTRLIVHSAQYGPEDGSALENMMLTVLARIHDNAIDMCRAMIFPRTFPEEDSLSIHRT